MNQKSTKKNQKANSNYTNCSTKEKDIKIRVSLKEKEEFRKLAKKENTTVSNLIRLMKDNYVSKHSHNDEKIKQETQMSLSNITYYLNQLNAGVNPEDAVTNLEKEVQSLCHIYI